MNEVLQNLKKLREKVESKLDKPTAINIEAKEAEPEEYLTDMDRAMAEPDISFPEAYAEELLALKKHLASTGTIIKTYLSEDKYPTMTPSIEDFTAKTYEMSEWIFGQLVSEKGLSGLVGRIFSSKQIQKETDKAVYVTLKKRTGGYYAVSIGERNWNFWIPKSQIKEVK